MELNYAIEKVRTATYHEATFFSDEFQDSLREVIVAAEKYMNIRNALRERESENE